MEDRIMEKKQRYFEEMDRDKTRKLQQAIDELKNTQSKLVHSEKMASIGQLAAGVAHEINNPMSFIISNLSSLKRYTENLVEYIEGIEELMQSTGDSKIIDDCATKHKQLKIDIIRQDIADLILESLDGAERVKKIVQNLKSFSRVDKAEMQLANINECLDTTLEIIWNELKYKATINKTYGAVPLTKCYPQELNQVFMNILINAVQAIEGKGEISIRTWLEDEKQIKVEISDTGVGIPTDNISKIFDPFFTTKEVGKGTGLGLSICYEIIKKHNGHIFVTSNAGEGSVFIISIPLIGEDADENSM
jgi:two-component system NtrC family sensor kinase